MSQSTPYSIKTAEADKVVSSDKTITNTDTGLVTEVTQVKNLTTGQTSYFNADGKAVVLGEGDAVADKAIMVTTGRATVADLTEIPAGIKEVPANSSYAYAEVKDGDCLYTSDGTAPSATPGAEVGKRVGNGGRIILRSADEIADFQAISYDGNPTDLDFTFQNVPA